ncbi:cysteine desulfurase [Candidatus Saganbacteria bacterium]|nr:cysteine desulfurase [Candidatus Saganbacteria bacterium]
MKKLYLDNTSGNPTDPRVVQAMLPYFSEKYGNPQSLHDWGAEAQAAISSARDKVARLINALPEEIFFTASGSESNNFAVKGLALPQEKKGKHIVVSKIEHVSILHSIKALEKQGLTSTEVPVDKDGRIDLEQLKSALRPETILVAVQHSNNEIGVLQPIEEIGRICREKNVVFHCDAVQSAGVVPLDVRALGVCSLSLSASQFYGPKGAAALFVKKGTRILPLIDGGIQEDGRRAGLENVPAIVGMGAAAELAQAEMAERSQKLIKLRDRLLAELPKNIPESFVTGHLTQRLPGQASFVIKFIEGESMMMFLNMEGIAVVSGSACTSRILKASHVLLALGLDPAIVHGSLVFGFSKDNQEADINYILEKLPPIAARLREVSPLWKKE